jgi:hypothetical protein
MLFLTLSPRELIGLLELLDNEELELLDEEEGVGEGERDRPRFDL